MISNSIPSPVIWTCAVAFIGTLGILVISNALIKASMSVKGIILYIGKNTLAIVCLHGTIIRFSTHYIAPHIPTHFVYVAIEQIFIWTMLFICIHIINAKFPWLVGKSKKETG